MQKKILIVEDESVIAFDLELILSNAGYEMCGIADSVPDALEIIARKKPEMVLLDIHLKGPLTGIDLARNLTEFNIPFVYLSANFHTKVLEMAKATQAYGFMVKPFRENELLVALDVAFYRHQNSLESRLRQEQLFEQQISDIVGSSASTDQKALKIIGAIQPRIPFDFLNVTFKANKGTAMSAISFLRVGFNEYQLIGNEEFCNVAKLTRNHMEKILSDTEFLGQHEFVNFQDLSQKLDRFPLMKVIIDTFKLNSYLTQSLITFEGRVFAATFYSRKAEGYNRESLSFSACVHQTLTTALEEVFSEVPPIHKKLLTDDPVELEFPKSRKVVFDGIIGNSHQMLSVQDMVSIVAPLDTSVLILGESGTGKERIAKSIHELSARRNKALVIVNCASLPPNLVESELFGHEKGAFTGAFERRIGKFELADNGTIFLDEIGEMTMELQVKLLRVLQEQEIERIGGKQTIKVNLRIIAATNRNLQKEVEEGRFRLDLYYRLYVFPITIPPLRERKDDIVLLAWYFLRHFSLKNGKSVTGFSEDALIQLRSYDWPGNVRELEHVVERSILLSRGDVIEEVMIPSAKKQYLNTDLGTRKLKTIEENARDHIIMVLKQCNWKVGGAGGAAEVLEVQANTLHSKIKKLGIVREDLE